MRWLLPSSKLAHTARGARADHPELLRMVANRQPREVVVAEEIDSISRLPLAGGEQVVGSVQVQLLKLALEMTRDDYGIRQTVIHENCLNRQFAVRKSEHCRMAAMRASSTAVMAENLPAHMAGRMTAAPWELSLMLCRIERQLGGELRRSKSL